MAPVQKEDYLEKTVVHYRGRTANEVSADTKRLADLAVE